MGRTFSGHPELRTLSPPQRHRVVKFFLHVSKNEQKRRFLERADNADKNWKCSASDMANRRLWDQYQDTYQDMIHKTASQHSPSYVVPADNKWFSRMILASAIIATLASLDLAYPRVSKEQLKEIADAKQILLNSK